MQPSTLKSHAKYRPDIDGLRAIAIISVVFNHAGFYGFSGGYVGVDVFFVISGYLITSLLFDEAVSRGTISLGAFYARRVRRLLPVGLLVVLVTLVLGGVFMEPGSWDQLWLARSALAQAFFSSNVYFSDLPGGYFDAPSFHLPLLHTWSLSVEEQYYLVWPLLMLLLLRLAGGKTRTENSFRFYVVLTLAAMALMSFALSVGTTQNYPKFAFYLLPARLWELAAGGVLGVAGVRFYTAQRRWSEPLAVIGIVLIGYSVIAFDHQTPFPGWRAILPVMGSGALIVGMTANEEGFVRRLLSCRPMVTIGLLSYSWYLWHWPLLSIYRIQNFGNLDVLANAFIVAAALIIAWLTFVLIERPIRIRRPWAFAAVRPTLLTGAAISFAMILAAGGLMRWRTHQKSGDLYLQVMEGKQDLAPLFKTCMFGGGSTEKPVEKLRLDECIIGPDPAKPKIALWGDSHAAHMLPMLTEAFPDATILEQGMAGCIPVIGYEMLTPAKPQACPGFNGLVLEELRTRSKQGLEAVVISARWEAYLWRRSISVADRVPGDDVVDEKKLAAMREAMKKHLDTTLDSLEQAGLRVVVLGPTPSLIYDPGLCIALRGGGGCDTPRSANDAILVDTVRALAEVVSRHPNTRLVEVIDFFCDTQTCPALRDGKFLYFDDDHISASAARALGRSLRPELAWLLQSEDKEKVGTK